MIKNNFKAISFGHKLVIDIGASDPRGTIKILDQLENGDSFTKKGYINDSRKGFVSEKQFINRLTEIITGICKEAQTKINKEKLTSIELFMPGPILNNCALLLANLRKRDGNSLTDVNLAEIINKLKEKSEKEDIRL